MTFSTQDTTPSSVPPATRIDISGPYATFNIRVDPENGDPYLDIDTEKDRVALDGGGDIGITWMQGDDGATLRFIPPAAEKIERFLVGWPTADLGSEEESLPFRAYVENGEVFLIVTPPPEKDYVCYYELEGGKGHDPRIYKEIPPGKKPC